MAGKFNSEYHHRRSIRLRDYDYSQAGAYFVTVCSYERECLFGAIVDGEVCLSEYGEVVLECWEVLPEHFSGAELDAFVVMPNHIHGVLVLYEDAEEDLSRKRPKLGKLVGSFKAAVSKQINELRGTPGAPVWQRNYHERIVRNERELDSIRGYIEHNPINWSKDQEHPSKKW